MTEDDSAVRWAREIEAAISELRRVEERAKEAGDQIARDFNYDFVAVQMADPGERIVQTIFSSDEAGRWYNVASHPTDVLPELQDIQAYVASNPVIKIVKGWDERFDEFIYRKYHHQRYLRIFVPLIVMREHHGRLLEAEAGWFDLGTTDSNGDFYPEQDELVRVVGCETDASATLHLRRKREETRAGDAGSSHYGKAPPAYWDLDIIGTIEAGYDCEKPGSEARQITVGDARALLATACRHAILLSKSTLQHVLQTVAARAREITRAEFATFELSDPRLEGLRTWSGALDETPYLHKQNHPLPYRPADRGSSTLFLGFKSQDRQENFYSKEEYDALQLFLQLASNAVGRATQNVRSLGLSRQLNNLHDIAIALAADPEAFDLLQTIAGHTLNLLNADLVVIHEFRSGKCEDTAVAGRTLTPRGDVYAILGRVVPANATSTTGAHGLITVANALDLATLYGRGDARSGYEELARVEQLSCGAAALLRLAHDEVVGVMLVSYRRQREFTYSRTKAIETVASAAAVAIRNRATQRLRRQRLGSLLIDLDEFEVALEKLTTDVQRRDAPDPRGELLQQVLATRARVQSFLESIR